MRVIGLDPGLQRTGWGILEARSGQLTAIACGVVASTAGAPLAERLTQIHHGLVAVLQQYQPDEAAVEETFVNVNPSSTLKLGHARAVALLVPALAGLAVHEYAAKRVKKSLVGSGSASKEQMIAMVEKLLPGVDLPSADAADALAVALCHAHHAQTAWAARAAGRSVRLARNRAVAPPTPAQGATDPVALRDLVDRELPGRFVAGSVAGQVVALMDADSRLVLELEGDPDARRQARLGMAGYRLLRVWPGDISAQPQQVVARIRAAMVDGQGRGA